MKKCLSLLLIIFALFSCSNGYHFKSHAIYSAKKSNLEIRIIASGFIEDGDDLTDFGIASGAITSTEFADTIYFKTSANQLIAFKCIDNNFESHAAFESALANCLEQLKHQSYTKNELLEIEHLIQGIAYGPKATYMQGQTDLLEVIEVNIETKRKKTNR